MNEASLKPNAVISQTFPTPFDSPRHEGMPAPTLVARKSRHSHGPFVALVLAMVMLGCGCSTTKRTQLERAAKDWCATIRASQVIPVYPLTEDIQPGDIFLVQVPVDKQQKIYDQKGYLPLDNHLDRLNPSGYERFYGKSFLASNTNFTLPAAWVRPNPYRTNSWAAAPNASFPSYSFSVKRGAGINLAFPVQGVPVGLSLLGSDAAEGTVIIKNAYTLGIDTISLYAQLRRWADTNSEFLGNFGSASGTNYVRVVSRIYAVGHVDVSLRDASSRSGGLDVGAAKPVNLLQPEFMKGTNADSGTIRTNFEQGNNLLQQMMTNALAAKDAVGNLLPGGSLRLTAASGRTISMRETFEPPLTIGYLGFDCPIMPGGKLGRPIPTYAILSDDSAPKQKVVKFFSQAGLDGEELTTEANTLIDSITDIAKFQKAVDEARRTGLIEEDDATSMKNGLSNSTLSQKKEELKTFTLATSPEDVKVLKAFVTALKAQ